MSVYNTSLLTGTILEIVQNLNTMSNGWLGLFLVYIPAIVGFLIALKQSDDIFESLAVSLLLCFGTTIIVRLMSLVDDYFVLINILVLALIGGYLFYRDRS